MLNKEMTLRQFNEDDNWDVIFGDGNWEGGFVNPVQNGESIFHEPLPNIPDIKKKDVNEIIAISNGENDGNSWLGLFLLTNGMFMMVRAWCDYTGWG